MALTGLLAAAAAEGLGKALTDAAVDADAPRAALADAIRPGRPPSPPRPRGAGERPSRFL
jgi:hypothetical protein